MNKLLLTALAVSAVLITGCKPQPEKNGGGVLLDPVRVYEVDGWGTNPDIYEFTPVGHDHMTCLIVVSGADQTGGMECFPKKKNDSL